MKKAQITEFIIIGIILLIAAGLFFYIQSRLVLSTDVPQDFLPVKTFVEGCTQQVTQEAIDLVGVQGGYIKMPPAIDYDPLSYIQERGIGFKIPLWYYKGENRMPTKQDMEQEISIYVEKNVQDCLINFDPFAEQFEIREVSSPKAQTTIGDKKVSVVLDYTIQIVDDVQDRTYELNEFIAESTSPLGETYDLAKEIMLTENEKGFLENVTMDMIAMGDFPLEGMELSCGKSWNKQQLKQQLASMLKYNLHYLTFEGTGNPDSGIEYFDSEETGYVQKASTKSNKNIQTEIVFDTSYGSLIHADPYGIDFDVYPSKGSTVTGVDMGVPIVENCIQIYHHFYTIEYPVIIRLTDYTDAENPYVFSYAIPVLITNNQPSREYDPTIIDQDLESITSSQYCDTAAYELEIYAIDKITQQEIQGANISYECVGFKCDIGTTEVPTFDGVPIARSLPAIIEAFPPCTNGFVVAKKEGYLEGAKQHTVGETMDHSTIVEMTPLKEMRYRFVIKQGAKTRIMEENEKIFLTIDNNEIPYSKTIYYPSEIEELTKLIMPVEDANYTLDIKLIRMNEELTGDETVTGGYELRNWTITADDILSNNLMIFTILSQDPEPTDIEGYINVYKEEIEPKSQLYIPRLEP